MVHLKSGGICPLFFLVFKMSYLKPNFKLSHPANTVLLCAVFFVSYFLALPVSAFQDDGTWLSGKFYRTTSLLNSAPTKSLLCELYTGGYVSPSGTHCFTPTITVGIAEATCTEEIASSYPQSGCGSLPDIECPPSGDTVRLAKVVNGSYVNDVFVPQSVQDGGPIIIGETISADGCGFSTPVGTQFDSDISCKKFDDLSIICFQNYQSSGSPYPAPDSQPMALIKENLSQAEESGSLNTTQNYSTKTVSDPVVSSEPDGTTVTTEQVSITDTKSDGTIVNQEQETIFISETDGIIKNEVVTTTTYENPDGTKTVTTETVTQFTQAPITNYTITDEGDTISITSVNGSSGSQTTTTTETYDSSGALTGSSQQVDHDGNPDAQQQSEDSDYCEQNPQSLECSDWAPKGDAKGFDMSEFASEKDAQLALLTTTIDQIKGEVSDMFDLDATGSQSLSCYSFFSYGGQNFDMCLSEYSSSFAIIGQAILFVVGLIVVVSLLRD